MKKDKKWFIATGAGLGIIFGFALWNVAAGMVIGAAIGLLVFTASKRK